MSEIKGFIKGKRFTAEAQRKIIINKKRKEFTIETKSLRGRSCACPVVVVTVFIALYRT
jgi:hypothetical protein